MQECVARVCSRMVWALWVLTLAACASKMPAPVESRGASRVSPPPVDAPVVARPGYYIVKRGDTLYSIAHQYERDYRELAAWNALDDPNVIKSGQELRVIPPASAADGAPAGGTTVVLGPPVRSRIESAPQGGAGQSMPVVSVVPTVVSESAPVGQKTEPKGGRLAYSEKAWKDLQASGKDVAPVLVPAKPVVVPQPADSRPAEIKQAGDDEIQWAWPGAGKVLAGFNENTNKGVDLAGNAGDPVLAAGAGQVVYVGSGLRGYGNLVIVKHNNNFLSAYAHNSEILVKEKQSVQKGQKIATLGSSDTDRPKLHFEIRRMGKPVDPMKYLPSR